MTKMISYLERSKVLISLCCLWVLSQTSSHAHIPTHLGNDDKLDVVVIDAGHGGKDPGASGARAKEKDIALSLALKLGKRIEESYPDIKVIYTRKDDRFIELHKRAKIANDANADLFISIHCNSTRNTTAFGSETFVLGLHKNEANLEVAKRENSVILLEDDYDKNYDFDINSKVGHIMLNMFQNDYLDKSISLASKIEKHSTVKDLSPRKSRGVKQAGFLVLKETFAPAVLVEAGFLSHYDEESYLISHTGQEEIVASVFNAFADYKKEVDKNTTAKPQSYADETPAHTTQTHDAVVAENKPSRLPSYARPQSTPDKQSKPQKAIPAASAKEMPQTQSTPTPGTKKEVETVVKKVLPAANNKLEYYIQLAAVSQKSKLSGDKWNRYNDLLLVRFEDGMYKYQLGAFDNYDRAQRKKELLKKDGFQDAFIIVYKGGAKIEVSESFVSQN